MTQPMDRAKAYRARRFTRKLEVIMFPRGPSYTVELLERMPLFGGLRRGYLDVIARHADQVSVSAGAVWVRHSRTPREILLVVHGSAEVERDGEIIGRLGPGDIFGDIELVDGERRAERVTAETPITLLVVEARSLSYLVRSIPELRIRLLAALRDRLRDIAAVGPESIPLPDQQPAVQRPEPIAVSEPTSS